MSEKKVEILESEYERLIRAYHHLNELEARGVDNWSGYVGSMYYCRECDEESEWYEKENNECPKCGKEESWW